MNITKQELRKEYRRIRNNFSSKQLTEESNNVCRQICNMDEYIFADAVFVYLSFGTELMTEDLIQSAFRDNKTVAVPKTIDNEMIFGRVMPDTVYVKNRYGIPEPLELDIVVPETFIRPLVILPGLCYDNMNGRIGYGGGYYDRYLAQHAGCSTMTVISAALSCQYYSGKIPMEAYDIRPDFVIYPQNLNDTGV